MNETYHYPTLRPRPHATTVSSLVSYLADCQVKDSQLTSMHIALALEYIYLPSLRFWRDFRIEDVADALSLHMPNWQRTAAMANGRAGLLLAELGNILAINAFDDANAEMMLAVPLSERPKTAASAFSWISNELVRKGLTAELEFARPDGDRCGEKALEVLHRLEQAQRGIVIERLGTNVARAYRDAVMNHRVGLLMPAS
ncbi:hypothetical protein [Paraburkholderia caribensis]|uniref:hypothetical protein n=1 Tax=Paraburkholderia caribensis TaxID=75105 RepID=UPI001CC75300|nr:hypothetical protein [Paraburkholderia caribensis]